MLGLLYFCYITTSFSKSTRIPAPPLPPKCNPPISTKYRCIVNSCTCGWCLLEDNRQTKKGHHPMGKCFVHSNHPEYIERKCGSVNSTVHTHVNSKTCHNENIFIISFFGVWFTAIFIVCIVGCIIGCTNICFSCSRELRRCDVPVSTVFNEL